MDVEDRIDLRRGDIAPAKAERAHAPLHRAEHIPRLVSHAVRGLIAEPDDALGIAAGSVRGIAAAGRDKALAASGHGIAERIEGRLGRRADLGADVRARDGVDVVAEKSPLLEALHIVAVEIDKPLL